MIRLILIALLSWTPMSQAFAVGCGGVDTVWDNKWKAELSDTNITFSLNNEEKAVNLAVERVEVTPSLIGYDETYSTDQTPIAQVVEQTCTINGKVYPKTLFLFMPNKSSITTYKGCCSDEI